MQEKIPRTLLSDTLPSQCDTMSPTTTSTAPLSVAIIGGGIGGLCTALALLKYPHIDVQVYEAAPTFGEIGAGVGIAPNAQRALELIGPAAQAAYSKHATGNMWPEHAKSMANYFVVSPPNSGNTAISNTLLSNREKVNTKASSSTPN